MSRRQNPTPRPAGRTALALALALWSTTAASAEGAGGRVIAWRGDVTVQTPGGRSAPQREQWLASAVLRTGTGASAQVLMPDGTTLALGPASELQWSDSSARTVRLVAGGLRIDATPAPRGWRVELDQRSVLTNGWLRLEPCAAGCSAAPGLYGRVAEGEAVLEYQGGRSVLRNRAFHWPDAAVRPQVVASLPAQLTPADDQAEAARVRAATADTLRTGLEAFKDGRYDVAEARLREVAVAVPGETLVTYYLGLIALERKDNDTALRLLQQYSREDPEGAAAREVPKTLTLLSSSQLQQEVATALARETEVVAAPPEPNSIAVHAFVNRSGDAYRAMAKGLAAMIIADLAKVPGLKVLEREKVQLLLDEMKLGDAGLADPASAVRSGRLMRAEKVIVGNFEVTP